MVEQAAEPFHSLLSWSLTSERTSLSILRQSSPLKHDVEESPDSDASGVLLQNLSSITSGLKGAIPVALKERSIVGLLKLIVQASQKSGKSRPS